MGRARDSAGNIWETDAQGNPVRLVQPATAAAPTTGRIFSLPPNPKDVRQEQRQAAADARAAEQMRLAEEANTRAAQAAAREQQKFESEDTMAPPPGNQNLTGEDYLKTIPPALAAQVKALSEGRRAFPTGTALRSPAVQQLIAAATQYDPTLDAANAATRVATRKKFTSGTTRDNITAINTALGHLGTLWEDAQSLNNFGSPLVNAPVNAIEQHVLGDPRYTNFNISRQAVTDELEKAFRGSGGTQQGIEEWKSSINNAQSPEQLRGAIGRAVTLLDSRLQALGDAYTQGMGHSADPMAFLNPHAQAVFNALGPGGDGKVPPLPKDFGGVPPILGGDGSGPTPPAPPSDISKTAAAGATHTVYDSRLSSQIDSMMNAGAPLAMINAVLKRQNQPPITAGSYAAAKQWMQKNPGQKYFGANISRTEDLNPLQRAAASPVATFGAKLADNMLAGIPGAIAGDAGRGAVDAASALNPNAALFGGVTGGVIGSAGAEAGLAARAPAALVKYAPRLADTLYGGFLGFNSAPDGGGLRGAAIGAGAGLVGGLAGERAAQAGGAVFRGVVNPAVQRLSDAGIPLTVGEVLGGGAKKAQDALTSVFGPGDMVARRYAEGRRALNGVAFNQAGDVVNTPINAVGNEGIGRLETAKSNAYSQALDPISLSVDPAAFEGVAAGADAIPAGELPQGYGGTMIRRYVNGNISPDGMMTGPDFQTAYRGLAQTANKAAPKIEGHDIGQALGQAKDILAGTLQEQNPQAYADFLKANSANRHLSILRDAVGAAKNQDDQLFTPAQLNNAAFSNTAKFGGKTSAAMGEGPFQQLATDAQGVMSSKLPDSGTAKRLMMLGLTTGIGSGGGYGLDGSQGAAEGGLGTALLLAAGGSKPAQRVLTNMLIKRPEAARQIGDLIAQHAGIGGWTGSGVLSSLVAGQ